jgi:hypothetical protein
MSQSTDSPQLVKRPRPAPVEQLVRKYLRGNRLLPLQVVGRPAAR